MHVCKVIYSVVDAQNPFIFIPPVFGDPIDRIGKYGNGSGFRAGGMFCLVYQATYNYIYMCMASTDCICGVNMGIYSTSW